MNVKVHVPEWVLEEDQRILHQGDELVSWLTFHEVGSTNASLPVETVRGVATPLPSWPGARFGRHPTRVDVDGGALYWDAPEPVEGEVELTGTLAHDNTDAPHRFPQTRYVVRGLSKEWHRSGVLVDAELQGLRD